MSKSLDVYWHCKTADGLTGLTGLTFPSWKCFSLTQSCRPSTLVTSVLLRPPESWEISQHWNHLDLNDDSKRCQGIAYKFLTDKLGNKMIQLLALETRYYYNCPSFCQNNEHILFVKSSFSF